jgi:hypothetical protein
VLPPAGDPSINGQVVARGSAQPAPKPGPRASERQARQGSRIAHH